jgi:hypothetical protein
LFSWIWFVACPRGQKQDGRGGLNSKIGSKGQKRVRQQYRKRDKNRLTAVVNDEKKPPDSLAVFREFSVSYVH